MKRVLFYAAVALMASVALSSCKSRESAYRQAYEKAKAAELQQSTTTTTVTPVETVTVETPQPTTTTTTVVVPEETVDNSDVRTIQGGMSVVSGSALRTYSVVVGSFVTQANAEGMCTKLRQNGYDARVVKTNETINGHTGWYRVIAASYDDKASAVQTRNTLRSEYQGAWLLLNQ